MKKLSAILFLSVLIAAFVRVEVKAQNVSFADSLLTIDPEMSKVFPRWKVCEPDLQFQIYQVFASLGYDKTNLDMQQIEVLAAPQEPRDKSFEILLLTCGSESMNSRTIDMQIKAISDYLSGKKIYDPKLRGDRSRLGERAYCYDEIPPEYPVRPSQAQAILDYLEPTDVTQAFTLSLFEQGIKIGESGFWLKHSIGTDPVGYQFWNSGEARVTLKRPLYTNQNSRTREKIPYLINAHLGGAYKINAGLPGNNSLFGWLPERILNSTPSGKIVAALDVHMPFHPEAGISINAELPIKSIEDTEINRDDYGKYEAARNVDFLPMDYRFGQHEIKSIIPVLGSTGQVTLFYNLWTEDKNPENYFRFDFGINYAEVQEFAMYEVLDSAGTSSVAHMDKEGIDGLNLYHPDEFSDWIFAKILYRSQAAFPFEVSLQLSNQILVARGYLPIFGNWLLLEGRFSTLMRDAMPYEVENFFMISPVIRLTI